MVKEKILSVGIDIGTSTTVVIFSHIYVENISDSFRMPDAKIVDKQVIYRSRIHTTPLLSNTTLDVDGITAIVRDEYARAGIDKQAVQTGAVIITGDTARKDNAEKVVHAISEYAGDFVVATAGPELESILAGKGSGAEQYSRDNIGVITNLDVGGGTTNIASFDNGAVVDVDCMDIGGRLIRFAPGTNRIDYLFPKIAALAEDLGYCIEVGNGASDVMVQHIAEVMAETLLERFKPGEKSQYYRDLLTHPDSPSQQPPASAVTFSGGVGELVYMSELPDDLAYDDIGVMLAKELKLAAAASGLNIVKPSETIGATVVGAGSHSMDISGSTILVTDPGVLPVKNVPILKIGGAQFLSDSDFSNVINQNILWIQGQDPTQQVALALDCDQNICFSDIKALAEKIRAGMADYLKRHDLLIVVMHSDLGKVLGQSLRLLLPPETSVICLDGVNVRNGDYIDIGRPVGVGDALPVVVKTLAFSY